MQDEKNQNQPDENILAAYEKIRRLGNIQSTIFTIADYLYTAAWVWFGLIDAAFYHCRYFERMKNMINEDFLRREMNDIKASNGYTIGTLAVGTSAHRG